MELSSSIHEDSRYISRSGSKQQKHHFRGDPPAYGEFEAVEDERQDVLHVPEQATWTADVANKVHNIFCQAPCFVNTSNSMDSQNPPDNRTEAPASPVRDSDDMALSGSSLHAPPSPPVRFPSLHLDASDWNVGEDDSAFFETGSGSPAVGARVGSRLHQQQSIYRTPSNVSAAFSKTTADRSACSQTVNNCGASLASTIATGTTPKFGIYRSPAWSDEDEDDDSDVVSIAGDDDWLDITPDYGNAAAPSYNNNNNQQGLPCDDLDTKTVIDVTYMEDLFNDFSLAGGSPTYGADLRR